MLAQRGCELLRKQTLLRLASEVFHGVSILLADTRENGAPIECKWPEMQAHDGGIGSVGFLECMFPLVDCRTSVGIRAWEDFFARIISFTWPLGDDVRLHLQPEPEIHVLHCLHRLNRVEAA